MLFTCTTLLKQYCQSFQGLPRRCWQGILINFFESTVISVFYFLPLYFVKQLGMDIAVAGTIVACYGVGAIVGGKLAGSLADRFTPWLVSLGCLVMQGVIFLVLAAVTAVPCLMGLLFFMGMASYGFITTNQLWTLAQCGQQEGVRLRVINLLNVAGNLSLGVSAIFLGMMTESHFQQVISVTGVLVFATALYACRISEKQDWQRLSVAVASRPVEVTAETVADKPLFYVVLSVVFLVGWVIFQLGTTYALYIQTIFPAYGVKAVGWLMSINTFLVVLCQAQIGDFFQRYSKRLMLGISGFCVGLGMCMLAFVSHFAGAILACVVLTLGEMVFFSTSQLLCYQNGPEASRGRRMGTYRMVFALSRVVGPGLGGVIYQYAGAGWLWWLCGGIGVVALVGAVFGEEVLWRRFKPLSKQGFLYS